MSNIACDFRGSAAPRQTGGGLAWLRARVSREILRAVACLASYSMMAKFVSGMSLLLSAWLFAPEEFTRFAVFLATLGLVSAMAFLRYESTILAAANARELRLAVRLSALVGGGVLGLLTLVVSAIVVWAHVSPELALLFVLAFAARSGNRILGLMVVRQGDFALAGSASFALAVVQPPILVAAVLFGAKGAEAMALTDLAGNLAAMALMLPKLRDALADAIRRRAGDPSLASFARNWASLPLVNLPATGLGAAFASVPLLVVLSLASADAAGHIALAFRLLDVPVQLLAAAIVPIALNRFSRRGETAVQPRDPVLVAWLALAVLAAFGLIIAGFGLIEPWLQGTKWQGLSTLIPLVAFFQAGVALALPLIQIADLGRNQRPLFAIQAAAVAAIGLVSLLAQDWKVALIGFGVIAMTRAMLLAAPLILPASPAKRQALLAFNAPSAPRHGLRPTAPAL